ncbi:hypothetical protein A3C20_01355 [Candidatus Kaiserbacteria bacterium RIFCSPHIGHO2_02_FULL_55_25]|uniref:DUF305 domain-containing protein n=1 Tax=Candidatus Kaiserbacteria bacterium RIFCSPHIGHO2_02_FULL_55_25 TaxID=1798498 RepID=A0A1F6EAD2_9BACT|nr:MAG: hypothetical protein A2764_00455 [Candidatus Kaiserbacteria bacterium RIFCSPHIGHO2_01_FULL_55_79]OGG70644.1 MAG: hypothetical protein A3C20_01355 [Candidatus Kaiserbacteria bacterium RIFCSPHIGHO2_02_FULL_55_25]OGG78191.1 MAG: hypothetical protein A3F56_00015 [Candidatus Kaiserbacteria bacterium RIFCSPHIGHO2_12_FULL_55_13]OGG82720.1 MAG: hypothetical protein A3A42_02520 [Candidatus Kaiserbacteria bacterium RIFCSPLOWO2_01_FULL_55_25]
MDKNTGLIIGLLVALVAGASGYFAGAAQSAPQAGQHMMFGGSMMGDTGMTGMSGAMDGMMAGISGKAGDGFDRAFLEGMIEHHDGAVRMAEEALRSAKHEELKSMARDIITAQTREIGQMEGWLRDWYGAVR